MRFILAADAASIHKIAQGRYFMDFNHCYNVYFRWWVLPHQRNVQGFGVVFSKTLHSNKAASLEDLGFQGLRLCSAYIIIESEVIGYTDN